MSLTIKPVSEKEENNINNRNFEDFAVPEKAGLHIAKPASPRFMSYDNRRIHLIPQLDLLDDRTRSGLLRASKIFPLKVNSYVLENLIDWDAAPDDPIYRLVFPHQDMLTEEADHALTALETGALAAEDAAARLVEIRDTMNPHPADQTSNIPILDGMQIEGIQHKYRETVLYFPKQGQTCHAYCAFCFRWPQFIETSAPKFESKDNARLLAYLRGNPHISDLLLTGGDPMVMNARRLAALLDPLLDPSLAHVSTIRIGSKSLTYWPYRFLTDPDADALLDLFKRLADGGKHIAFMAHINHWREIEPEPVQAAIARLRQAGVTIRSQAPLIRRVNDNADTWRRLWSRQVELGIQPYYMFVERDTGATQYFGVTLAEAHRIYKGAISSVSGLARTARGPVMSTSAGKVQILGPMTVNGQKALALTMLQSRNPDTVHDPFLAKYSQEATWIDQLEPFDPVDTFPFGSKKGAA
ncbi:KamA family radical SAM protein [Stappia taiwanensis]|nr:lysine 2,3-aminomutase [Stappia taiwanensis]